MKIRFEIFLLITHCANISICFMFFSKFACVSGCYKKTGFISVKTFIDREVPYLSRISDY